MRGRNGRARVALGVIAVLGAAMVGSGPAAQAKVLPQAAGFGTATMGPFSRSIDPVTDSWLVTTGMATLTGKVRLGPDTFDGTFRIGSLTGDGIDCFSFIGCNPGALHVWLQSSTWLDGTAGGFHLHGSCHGGAVNFGYLAFDGMRTNCTAQIGSGRAADFTVGLEHLAPRMKAWLFCLGAAGSACAQRLWNDEVDVPFPGCC